MLQWRGGTTNLSRIVWVACDFLSACLGGPKILARIPAALVRIVGVLVDSCGVLAGLLRDTPGDPETLFVERVN